MQSIRWTVDTNIRLHYSVSDGIPVVQLGDAYSPSTDVARCLLAHDMMTDSEYSMREDGSYHACSIIVD